MKPDPSNKHLISNSTGNRLHSKAQQLLELPRVVKRSIFITADFIMSVVCLFFALALRYGYIANHISPLMLCLYAIPPIIGLYIIGFYKGVARIFFDTVMRNVLQLFIVLIIGYEVVHYFELLPAIPRSVPVLYLFLFFIWLWNSRLSIRELLERSNGASRHRRKDKDVEENIIIYGAGAAGTELFDALGRSHK